MSTRTAALLSAGAVAAVLLVPGPPALAASVTCPPTPLETRLAAADVAFVGRVLADRAAPGGGTDRIYRFKVDHKVRGSLGPVTEVTAPLLVDVQGKPVLRNAAMGVLVTLDGATLTTTSCGLTDPGGLLSVADKPKGQGIRVGVGVVILALVIGFGVLRLRRRDARAALARD